MARKRTKKKLVRPKPIDGHVGARVKQRRVMLGMSQQALAAKLGITFQQLQKNERGTNRIGSSRLLDLSNALDVPIQYFFDEMPDALARTAKVDRFEPPRHDDSEDDPLSKTETLRLVRAYYQIENPKVRRQVYALAKELADEDG